MLQALIKRRFVMALVGAGLLAASAGASHKVSASPAFPIVVRGFDFEHPIAAFAIDRRGAAAIAAKVRSAGAYAMPLRGHPLPQLTEQARRQLVATPDRRNLLQYYGGPTLSSASIYNIYVNAAGTYWGNPASFITNWNVGGTTTFLHVLDQYTSSAGNGRYPYGGGIQVTYDTSGQLSDQDIYNIIHPVAVRFGAGYTSVYHVYFKNGVQECSNFAGGCYAVDYCAYHGSVDFSDIGHTIYSFEGFQNISGCNAPSGTTRDSTDSTMSHEMYESITDPDINNGTLAWYNQSQGEIGDICRFNYGHVTLNHVSYNIQKEWSNKRGACTYLP